MSSLPLVGWFVLLVLLMAPTPTGASGLVTLAGPPSAPVIKPGQTIALPVGVRNTGGSAVDGVVVNIRVSGGLSLPREFTNCRYYQDGILGGAWCALPQRVGAGAAYALSGFHVTASATAQRVSPVVFEWHPASSAPGQAGVAGSGGTLSLAPAKLAGPAVGAIYLRLVTSTNTRRPSRTASSRSPSSVSPRSSAPAGRPAGSELAGGETETNTGTNVVLLAVGTLLLIGGATVVLVRRRSRYVGKHS